jgi:hypothetical protein
VQSSISSKPSDEDRKKLFASIFSEPLDENKKQVLKNRKVLDSLLSEPLDKNTKELFDSILSGNQYKNKEKFIVEYKAAFDSLKNRVIYKPFNQRPQVLQNDLEAFRNFMYFLDFENPWLNSQVLVNCKPALLKSILQRDRKSAFQNIDAIDTILKPFFTGDLS